MSKQYGLILPNSKKEESKKPAPIFAANRNVFGDDSDSDENVKISKIPINTGEKSKRQAKVVQQKVLDEDPTVYQYDELYEDMSAEKNKKKLLTADGQKKEEKKSKYIDKLLQSADRRKKENERRIERQIQKEREEEGDKFADKESFVTSAYKLKLEEMKQQDELEQREKYLEEIGDVTKQSDLGGFYRHLYEQQLRPEKQRTDTLTMLNSDKSKLPEKEKVTLDRKDSESTPESDEGNKTPEANKKENKRTNDKRTYRKRKSSIENDKTQSDSDSDAEVNRKAVQDRKLGKKPKLDEANPDADSDFSIDESSSESDEENVKKSDKKKDDKNKMKTKHADKDKKTMDEKDIKKEVENSKKDEKDESEFKKPNDVSKAEVKVEDVPAVVEEVKPKIDIWKKRTVGEVFDEALQRYYQRKSLRSC